MSVLRHLVVRTEQQDLFLSCSQNELMYLVIPCFLFPLSNPSLQQLNLNDSSLFHFVSYMWARMRSRKSGWKISQLSNSGRAGVEVARGR